MVKDIPLLARTHGQAASPTRMGKEIQVFIERIENAVPPMILEYIRTQIQNEERWSFSYPKGASFEKKHPKLTIYDGSVIPEAKFLEGISHMVLLMIYNKIIKDGNDFFNRFLELFDKKQRGKLSKSLLKVESLLSRYFIGVFVQLTILFFST